MILAWIITLCTVTCGWSRGEVGPPPEQNVESRADLILPDYNPLSILSERYFDSQVKGHFLNPDDTRYAHSTLLARSPYPAAAPYNAAKEYGLPGLGYVITDPYSVEYSPLATSEEENTWFSISSEPADKVTLVEEESSATTTLTTPRPTKPPLPPPPPPPPLPLPPPPHSTFSLNLSPPRQPQRLPKIPPKPHTSKSKGAHKKKPKKKLNKNWDELDELHRSFINDQFEQRKYIIEKETPENEYELVNRAVLGGE